MAASVRFVVVCSWLLVPLVMACHRPTRPGENRTTTTSSTGEPHPSSSAPHASLSASAATGATPTGTTSFDAEPAGEPSPSFDPVVGDWYVTATDKTNALKVDGSKWRKGAPSMNLVEQAKRQHGERYAESLDGVKAFAFFPLAVWKNDPPAGDFSVSVRFYPLAGSVDQAAGIAFAVEPDGSYFGVRANALEDNFLFFRVVGGKRTIIDNIRKVSTPTKTWHTLSIELRGKSLLARLDGQEQLDKELDRAPTGKVGLWSKADSQILFDDFKVTPIPGATP